MLRVLIADDHPVVRYGLKLMLNATSDIVVAEEAETGEEVVAKALGGAFDVVVLDLSMPGKGGLAALHSLRRLKPELPVLVLSSHSEEHYAVRCLQAGASGYLTKDAAPAELVAAVRQVARGGRYISGDVAGLLAERVAPTGGRRPHEHLSDREFHILALLVAGRDLSEIAESLSLSVPTASTCRSQILKKLDLDNVAQLIQYAHRNNLLG